MDIRELKTMDVGQLVQAGGRVRDRERRGRAAAPGAGVPDHPGPGAPERLDSSPTACSRRVPEGYGFLRALEASYLPGPDDVYVSPQQIRRFDLHDRGRRSSGQVRPPKPGERYFALARVDTVNGCAPEQLRGRKTFDNLTPLYPRRSGSASSCRAPTSPGRVIDLMTPARHAGSAA